MRTYSLLIVILILGCSIALCQSTIPAESHHEEWYQNQWCNLNSGEIEFRFVDNTRADCLTSDYAIEFDFGRKWAEAIGQALHYAQMSGKKAGIVLILEQSTDARFLDILKSTIVFHHLPIRIWAIDSNGDPIQ